MRTSKRNKNKQLAKKNVTRYKKSHINDENNISSVKNLPDLTANPISEPNIPRRSHITYPLTHRDTRSVLMILSCYAIFSLWIMQNSVNAYYLQTYHRESPLLSLNQWSVWRWGGYVGEALNTWRDYINQEFATANQISVEQHNKKVSPIIDDEQENMIFPPNNTPESTVKNKPSQVSGVVKNNQLVQNNVNKQNPPTSINHITLTSNDAIFFAGDSMMQGVAPHIQKALQQYKIKSINLSKQSTGLSYPKFFNWPQTIKETLTTHPNIKVLVIFLGPNDPWDIINPRTGKYIKFQSPEWEQTYRSRMADILNTAKEHQVQVIWVSPPNMKKVTLNQQMTYLNKIMAEEVQSHQHTIWIDSRPLVGGKDDIYNDYLVKNGQTIKMRSSDGIHFSLQGQKEMANIIQQHLTIIP